MDKQIYENYVTILRHELIPALGCTEPIAIALCAAKAREVLGTMPDSVEVRCSGNIIKNVKGVTVPNSGGMKGIEAAAVLGIIGGNADGQLEVLKGVTDDDREATKEFLRTKPVLTSLEDGEENLFIRCSLKAGTETAEVELKTNHDHISRIVKNGELIFEQPDLVIESYGDKSLIDLCGIFEFASTCDLNDIRDVLERQLECNCALAEEGLKGDWGVNAGSIYMQIGDSLRIEAAARAAAGSDARMSGCSLPAVINSGSGNQGITITLPIAVYEKRNKPDHDKVLRALALANLISIHQKKFIGNLSCYCGATSAATASICGIAYLEGASRRAIGGIIENSICTLGGMVCDGAKPSCATKIRAAVDNAFFASDLVKNNEFFLPGEGLMGSNAEQTIRNIGRMGKVGMASTDIEVLHIMIGK